jgi:hypothetical protein
MAKFIEIDGTKILCKSLTFGYMYDVENGFIQEDILTAVEDATDLTTDEIRALTRVDVLSLWEEIKRQTYPEIYNEDGTLIEMEATDEVEDKKKV